MYRLCLLGCVVLLASCGEKAPDEGAIRVAVAYGSFKPACVRVEVKDANGHQDGTDIPSTQFKNADKPEILVAVRRKPEWDTALSVTVSSYAEAAGNRCTGDAVEGHTSGSPVVVPAKAFARWDVRLAAEDADQDGHLVGAMWDREPDCDDSNAAIHPGAVETCSSTVDLNCNQRVGCQEANCGGSLCDDGNACTTGDHCEGVGLAAKCMPSSTVSCPQPSGVCDARQECKPATGRCEAVESTEGRPCDDNNGCTNNDLCGNDGACRGTPRTCESAEQCKETQGTCEPATGLCSFAPLPNTASCQDGLTCTTPDLCDGQGHCVGTPTACIPSPCYRVKQVCTTSAECAYEVDVNAACTTSGGVPGVCLATAECSPFPYRPLNFDPNAIAAADIGELKTSGNVTFDTTDSSWTPASSVPTRATLKIVTLQQGAGNPPALLIPVRTLELNGTLQIKGPLPVILAVYGDATVSQSILATGSILNGNAECGASAGGAGTFGGKTGGGGGGAANGTTGVEGGRGYNNGQSQGTGGASRSALAEPLLGGCPGGNGGGATPQPEAGKGGAGGGAIQLSVARTLTISKVISTSGDGGTGGKAGGNKGGGGGGGGSGGRVVLEAFQLSLTSAARITANGGGGGKAGTSNNNAGSNGANGSQDTAAPAGGGTQGNTTGGEGGGGGALSAAPGRGVDGIKDFASTEGGGGGGGGSVGYIHLRSVKNCTQETGAILSPNATGGCVTP
ncbi:putative metal-binding motif-containing protein [Corallococcus silvisoli]|uniref:putative metal-binding motif-containing protein n=1 Tax=Corallococcus silvisoli TaxID=2697031 RepID=UPI001378B07E|nr:putative metal-binding motif-containing protein [Corallococcus silvisoli]NBD12039.1 hypothetical protein [Corallococcus silvisoli]